MPTPRSRPRSRCCRGRCSGAHGDCRRHVGALRRPRGAGRTASPTGWRYGAAGRGTRHPRAGQGRHAGQRRAAAHRGRPRHVHRPHRRRGGRARAGGANCRWPSATSCSDDGCWRRCCWPTRLPAGGHAHSGGVEAAVERGLVRDDPTSRCSWPAGCDVPGRWSPRSPRPAACWRPTRRRWTGGAGCSRSDARTPSAGHAARHRGAQGAALLRTARRVWPSAALEALHRTRPPAPPARARRASRPRPGCAPRRPRRSRCTTCSVAGRRGRRAAAGPGPDRVHALIAGWRRVRPDRRSRRGRRRQVRGCLPRGIRRCWTCSPRPRHMGGTTLCLLTSTGTPRPDEVTHVRTRAPDVDPHAPLRTTATPGRCASASAARWARGKTALVAALCRALARRAAPRRRHQRHLHHRGRRLPAPQRGAARRADPGGGDRLLPAHRDPRRHHRQPRRRRGPGGALAPPGPGPGRERRRQPHRHLQLRPGRRQIFVLDVAGGDKVPRKGGPGVTAADLLVINKTDLAPLVGADLDVMRRDAAAVRGEQADAADLAAGAPRCRTGRGLGS